MPFLAEHSDEGIGHYLLTGFGNDMEGYSRTMPAPEGVNRKHHFARLPERPFDANVSTHSQLAAS
jgi:hypothetical protein